MDCLKNKTEEAEELGCSDIEKLMGMLTGMALLGQSGEHIRIRSFPSH